MHCTATYFEERSKSNRGRIREDGDLPANAKRLCIATNRTETVVPTESYCFFYVFQRRKNGKRCDFLRVGLKVMCTEGEEFRVRANIDHAVQKP